jgi:hypothetical protein
VVGVAGGKVLTLLLKFMEPRLLPAIDKRFVSVGWKDESNPGEPGDEEPNEMIDAVKLLAVVFLWERKKGCKKEGL